MIPLIVRSLAALALVLGPAVSATAQTPAGEAVMAWHVTIAPTWFDPSTAPPQITPFGLLYAIHDALVRPLPGHKMAPSLAESWTESPDGLVYEFKLRRGLKFHNGDPVTTEDVKFSFDRYRGAGSRELQARVRQVEIVDPLTVRFHMKEPWPDFMTFYGTTATAAGLVVPKKYLTQVGDDGFTKSPIGAGPYKFVSQKPGIEIVLEAYPAYWRHAPYVKRLVMKGVPDSTTRAAMLKTGEADIAYALDGPDAETVKRDPRLQVVPSKHASINWLEFADQWDPEVTVGGQAPAAGGQLCAGPQGDQRGRVPRLLPAGRRDRPARHGLRAAGRAPAYDPQRAKQLLAEAGYPNGLDAGEVVPIPPFFTMGEAVVNYLNAVGIRTKMRQMERATFYAAWREKKLRGLFITGVGNSGNAASRVQEFIYSKGSYAYGGYPDIDDLFQLHARGGRREHPRGGAPPPSARDASAQRMGRRQGRRAGAAPARRQAPADGLEVGLERRAGAAC